MCMNGRANKCIFIIVHLVFAQCVQKKVFFFYFCLFPILLTSITITNSNQMKRTKTKQTTFLNQSVYLVFLSFFLFFFSFIAWFPNKPTKTTKPIIILFWLVCCLKWMCIRLRKQKINVHTLQIGFLLFIYNIISFHFFFYWARNKTIECKV